MAAATFQSSDSDRHARPLKYAQTITLDQPLALERGGTLPEVTVVYETYGRLNPRGDNAVLVCHALTGDSHVAAHDADDDPGWWDVVVGPGNAVDTDRYFVICPNLLGGCRGTTGPHSINPATGNPYGRDFPLITVGDMVRVQRALIERLGIQQLLAVVGGSLGGHQVLDWAVRFPALVRGAVALATSPRLTSQALAYDVIGRNAILRDPHYHAGQYYERPDGPTVGLAIARMLGHLTYLSREAMTLRFDADRLKPRDIRTEFETRFSVGSYLAHQGDKFVERFDANSYLTLSMAMDLFDLGDTPADLAATLGAAKCRWLTVSIASDLLFPPFQSQQIVRALLDTGQLVTYCNIPSLSGHDAFLLAEDLPHYGPLVGAFLDQLSGTAPAPQTSGGAEAAGDPTSIFHARRLDYDLILELIPPGASVLDLGCGVGDLLQLLRQRGHSRVTGVEVDIQAIQACARRGLDVVDTDLNQGLGLFGSNQYDCVVLSQTLQAVGNVEQVIADMLRVGRQGIVSFPNFAYHKFRRNLAEDGRAPRAAPLLDHPWYNTPNIRFCSIADFEDFCRDKHLTIHRQIALDAESGKQVTDDPNRNADLAIFVIGR
jgi:homoserine O-acetyltransferase